MSHEATIPTNSEREQDEQLLSYAALCRRYRKSRMTIHRWVKAGYLPPPVQIGQRGRGFWFSEIRACEQSWPRANQAERTA